VIQSGTITETADGKLIVSNGSVFSSTLMEDKPTVITARVRGPTTLLIDRKSGVFTLQDPR
jgi:hypothetical protein